MTRKHPTIIALLTVAALLVLDRVSYYNARSTLYREFSGLAELPVTKGGGLARHPGGVLGFAWLFDFYPTNEAHASAEHCEDAQMWVSLSGAIVETHPLRPGIPEWMR